MKRKELTIDYGGLMRCCTQSAYEWIQAEPDGQVEDGQAVVCKYENEPTMVVDGSVLRWEGARSWQG